MDNIPLELRALPNWVAWRQELRESAGKSVVTKLPVNPRTGSLASTTNPVTWGSVDDAMARYECDGLAGIGFVFSPPFCGIDLDKCRNPETGIIEPWAAGYLGTISSYSEVSPSGTGVHVIVKATLDGLCGNHKGQIEIYDHGRFFTVTGSRLLEHPTTIEFRQAEVEAFHVGIFGPAATATTVDSIAASKHEAVITAEDDESIIQRIQSHPKYDKLWAGDHSQYPSQSEADLALCGYIACFTGADHLWIDRLFRQSGLYRPKWDERHGKMTYGASTVAKAAQGKDRGGVRIHRGSTASDGTGDGLPEIRLSEKQLREKTDEGIAALQESNDPPHLFVRRGLIRIRRDERDRPMIETLEVPALSGILSQSANFFVEKGKEDFLYLAPADPPRRVVENILSLGTWPFPPLERIIETPQVRLDGSILAHPGYDPATRLYYAPPVGFKLPPVPEAPTEVDVVAALGLIGEAIGEFPLVDANSKANLYGALITPVVRAAIEGPCPLLLIDKPQRGTGASLLSEVLSLVATGRAGPFKTAPEEEDEWRKFITATLVEGSAIVILDNVEKPLASSNLAAVLTATAWRDRVLGRSETTGDLPCSAIWAATGNNLTLRGDIARRAYWVRLDAKLSKPWEREGFKHPDLKDWVSKNRAQIIHAILVLVRRWITQGRPAPAGCVPQMGGFTPWRQTIGGILAICGMGEHFLGNAKQLHEGVDEEATEWEAFLEALLRLSGGRPMTSHQITGWARDASTGLRESLPGGLAEALDDPTKSFERRLGKALRRKLDVRHGTRGLRIQGAPGDLEVKVRGWRVVEEGSTEGGGVSGLYGLSAAPLHLGEEHHPIYIGREQNPPIPPNPGSDPCPSCGRHLSTTQSGSPAACQHCQADSEEVTWTA